MAKPDHDTMMRLIRQHFNEDAQRLLTFTRWKDGIDVQYPTYAIEAFFDGAAAVERERIAKGLESEADHSPCPEDASVHRGAAWLVRGDFSYEQAERLQIAAEASEQPSQ